MTKSIVYISYEEVIEVYQKTIEKSGGGLSGMRDQEGILTILEFIKNDNYYPSFADKLTYLVFRICSGHFFEDGNKRIAITLGVYFLFNNGYTWEACTFMKELEAIVYHVAASNIDRSLFHRIITCFLERRERDEHLKIDIMKAINRD